MAETYTSIRSDFSKGEVDMSEIKKAEDLMAVSARQGVKMNSVEAAVALSYVRGTGFFISSNEHFEMLLHDGDTAEGSENCYE